MDKTSSFDPIFNLLKSDTGHWYHFTENIITNLDYAMRHIWTDYSKNSLIIVFRDRASADKISSFGLLIITAIMSGGLFRNVQIGYTIDALDSRQRSRLSSLTFFPVHSVSRNSSDPAALGGAFDFLKSAARLRHSSARRICLAPGRTHRGRYRPVADESTYYWFNSSRPQLLALRTAVSRLCALDLDDPFAGPGPPPAESLLVSQPPGEGAAAGWVNSSVASAHGLSPAALWSAYGADLVPPLRHTPVTDPRQRIVRVYQRNTNRRFQNLPFIEHRLKELLAEGAAKRNDSTAAWRVEVLMHSDDRPICELVRLTASSPALLTPHGFQSVLTLFQPQAALLAEVHPAMYDKPGYYGQLNANLRVHMGLQRAYLHEESGLDSKAVGGIIGLLARSGLLGHLCGATATRPLCRYLCRLQSVSASDAMLQRVASHVDQFLS